MATAGRGGVVERRGGSGRSRPSSPVSSSCDRAGALGARVVGDERVGGEGGEREEGGGE